MNFHPASRFFSLLVLIFSLIASSVLSPLSFAATIGVDNLHGFNADAILASGSDHSSFRSVITGAGHTIVPLTAFNVATFAGLDAVILTNPYNQNTHTAYSSGEMTAIQNFVSERAVFLDDKSIFSNGGADRPITFGDNTLLLQNILGFISTGNGALFLGENGTGFNVDNMNALVAPYGVSFANSAIDGSGRTVSGFVPHPVTAGLQQIGVDFHLPMTITGPAIDLTTGGGDDNVLAVFERIPEPAALVLFASATVCCLLGRRRSC